MSLPDEPIFSRSEVAKILNVTPLTIANREKANKYPPPQRDVNNYRVYSINDVLNLQVITFRLVDQRPIISVLYDKGYKDFGVISKMMDTAMNRRTGANVARG
jgi:hypothetical protein